MRLLIAPDQPASQTNERAALLCSAPGETLEPKLFVPQDHFLPSLD